MTNGLKKSHKRTEVFQAHWHLPVKLGQWVQQILAIRIKAYLWMSPILSLCPCLYTIAPGRCLCTARLVAICAICGYCICGCLELCLVHPVFRECGFFRLTTPFRNSSLQFLYHGLLVSAYLGVRSWHMFERLAAWGILSSGAEVELLTLR